MKKSGSGLPNAPAVGQMTLAAELTELQSELRSIERLIEDLLQRQSALCSWLACLELPDHQRNSPSAPRPEVADPPERTPENLSGSGVTLSLRYIIECGTKVSSFSKLEATMTAEDILNALEDLTEDDFKNFKWYLQQPDILGGYQAIKVSKLEKAERWDTVNVMVNTYKPDGALKVTKKVLEKINRNDLVQSLSDTSSGPRVSVDVSDDGETSENRGTSSSRSEGHKTHDVVPLREEYKKQKDELEAQLQQMVQERQLKTEEMMRLLKLNQQETDRKMAESFQVSTALRESAERRQADLLNALRVKQNNSWMNLQYFYR
ncbi:hypothetical protein ABVT39_003719 [Epinephelus coioides]